MNMGDVRIGLAQALRKAVAGQSLDTLCVGMMPLSWLAVWRSRSHPAERPSLSASTAAFWRRLKQKGSRVSTLKARAVTHQRMGPCGTPERLARFAVLAASRPP